MQSGKNMTTPAHHSPDQGLSLSASLAVLLFMCFMSVVMTWPLASVAGYEMRDYGDPLLNSWILWWGAKVLGNPDLGLSLFDAPIFFPQKLTLAYSEHMIVSAISMMPLFKLGLDALLIHNILFMLSFAVSGWGGFILARRLSGSMIGGVIAGLGYGFSCFRFDQLGHLQILTAHFIPFALYYLHRWNDRPTWGNTFGFWLFWLLQVLTCGYHALFVSMAIGLFWLYYGVLGQWWRAPKRLLQIGAACLCLALVVLPYFLPYLEVRQEMGFKRDLGEAIYYSAKPWSYLAASPENLLYGSLTKDWGVPEKRAMLGITLSALAVMGIAAGLRTLKIRGSLKGLTGRLQGPHKDIVFYLILAALAFWASLGPWWGLYYFMFKLVPGFDNLRVPARLAVLVTLAWSVLASYGAAWLCRRWTKGFWLKLLPGLLCALVILEAWHAPLTLSNLWRETPKVYQHLAEMPGRVVLYEIPSFDLKEDLARDARYLYWSTKHERTLINGYSGYFPDYYIKLARTARKLDFDHLLPKLRELGATHLLWHRKEYPGNQHRAIFKTLSERRDLKLVFETRWDYLYEILDPKD